MDAATRNLLYRRPELYERVYLEPHESAPRFCQAMFARHLGRPVQSILDMGCGTGRDLAVLARDRPNRLGCAGTCAAIYLLLSGQNLQTLRMGSEVDRTGVNRFSDSTPINVDASGSLWSRSRVSIEVERESHS